MSAAPAPPPDERPATAPSPRRGRLSATHRVAAKLNLVRDSSMERLDLEHRIAAWQRQRRVAMLSRHDFILENRNELPTRTLASVYQRRSKLYVEQCHKGEQARVRRSEQIRQVEQRIFEKGLRDVRRHAEVQQRRDEVQARLSTPRLHTPRPGTARTHLPAVTASSPRRPQTAPELTPGAASGRRRQGLPDAQASPAGGSQATPNIGELA